MAPLHIWERELETWGYGYNSIVLNTTTYSTLTRPLQQLAPVYRLLTERPWTNYRERDRWHLACARSPEPAPLVTPTIRVRTRYWMTNPLRARPARSRWDRNPLNKRALARR